MEYEEFFEEVVGILADREEQYGDSAVLFREIAQIWTVMLSHKVEPEQVALCMMGVKLARLSWDYSNADSIKDIAGYAAILSQLISEERTQ